MRSDRKRLIIVVVAALFLTTAALLWRTYWNPTFLYAGTVEATRIDLPARVPTVVEAIYVEEGQTIQKNQKLVSLACEDLNLAQRLATQNYDRAFILRKSGAISKESFEAVQNKKQDADTRLSWCTITAPVSGTVLTRYLEPTEWVNPGTKILSVADLAHLWTYFYVPEKMMSHLKLGSRVQGRVPELGDGVFEGRIVKINSEAEFTPKNVQTRAERTRLVFGIKVAFDNVGNTLKPGMTIESSLEENPEGKNQ
ncbi:MAG: HlyD family secretion protein [Pseudobdellovibrionaceae bacterium]